MFICIVTVMQLMKMLFVYFLLYCLAANVVCLLLVILLSCFPSLFLYYWLKLGRLEDASR